MIVAAITAILAKAGNKASSYNAAGFIRRNPCGIAHSLFITGVKNIKAQKAGIIDRAELIYRIKTPIPATATAKLPVRSFFSGDYPA